MEFNSKFYKLILGTAIGAKFAPLYACIFIDYIEKQFLKFRKTLEKIHQWYFFQFDRYGVKSWLALKNLKNFTPTLPLAVKNCEKKQFLWCNHKINARLPSIHFACLRMVINTFTKRSIVFSQTSRQRKISLEKRIYTQMQRILRNGLGKAVIQNSLLRNKLLLHFCLQVTTALTIARKKKRLVFN